MGHFYLTKSNRGAVAQASPGNPAGIDEKSSARSVSVGTDTEYQCLSVCELLETRDILLGSEDCGLLSELSKRMNYSFLKIISELSGNCFIEEIFIFFLFF